MNNAPIGIFDSGLGGLTVARAVIDKLPDEEIIYLGDTEHTPYGPSRKFRSGRCSCIDLMRYWELLTASRSESCHHVMSI